MTPARRAAERAEEIEKILQRKKLAPEQRRELERELGAIADNMTEGCYSRDPDDGIDWSDCPGIYDTPKKEPPPTPARRPGPYERTRAAVYATGNRWATENFNATH